MSCSVAVGTDVSEDLAANTSPYYPTATIHGAVTQKTSTWKFTALQNLKYKF